VHNDPARPHTKYCNKREVDDRINRFNPEQKEIQDMYKLVSETMGVKKIVAVEVDHCPQSYGCLIITNNDEKILYSGDTVPCQNLMNYAKNCKVLIHEATLADQSEMASQKKHTTVRQAIELAKQVKAWRLILTHFSPRYNKLAPICKGEK
jgi:ribonuclease Z